MGITLVVNPGSTSRKYVLYNGTDQLLELAFEQAGEGHEVCTRKEGVAQTCGSITDTEFSAAVQQVATETEKYLSQLSTTLDVIGVRVVAPGTHFQRHQIIDDAFMYRLRQIESAAPLHLPALIREIDQLRLSFPGTPLIAVSDSAFHATMPTCARDYSLPQNDTEMYDIHRFGYHGLSVASVLGGAATQLKYVPARVIVVHVGGGVSVTAVRDGKSIDTTMGFAPGSGLVMGSRGGDVDAGALLYLMQKSRLDPLAAEIVLQKQSGLYALAGESDLRRLLERQANGDVVATSALTVFMYHLQKTIGGFAAVLGGLDAIVLTATAMERSATLRSQLCSRLRYPLGVQIGAERNESIVGRDGIISSAGSVVPVVVVRTGEMFEIKRIAEAMVAATQE